MQNPYREIFGETVLERALSAPAIIAELEDHNRIREETIQKLAEEIERLNAVIAKLGG